MVWQPGIGVLSFIGLPAEWDMETRGFMRLDWGMGRWCLDVSRDFLFVCYIYQKMVKHNTSLFEIHVEALILPEVW